MTLLDVISQAIMDHDNAQLKRANTEPLAVWIERAVQKWLPAEDSYACSCCKAP